MWSAGVKVMNFQNRTEPIRLFNISCFPSIVKDELAVLQQRTAAPKTAETRITYDTLLWAGFYLNKSSAFGLLKNSFILFDEISFLRVSISSADENTNTNPSTSIN